MPRSRTRTGTKSISKLDPYDFWPKPTALKMKAIRKQYSNVCNWTESNPVYDMRAEHSRYSIQYGYQRLNLSFPEPWKDQPYTGLQDRNKRTHLHLLFTSSGQGASAAVFLALKSIGITTVCPAESLNYYETTDLIEKTGLNISKKSSRRRSAFLLDSSTLSKRNFSIPNCRFIVVDTTCWDLNDKAIQTTVGQALKRGMIAILIRSHTKLDSFGTEWGRLGSIVTIASSESALLFEKTRKTIVELSSVFGVRAEISSLYPFLKDKNHTSKVSRWIKTIRSSNNGVLRTLKAKLNPKQFEIVGFEHSLFFWIKVKGISFSRLMQREKNLVENLVSAGIPALVIASFPWDFVAITTFDMKLAGNESVPVLRISCPPLSKKHSNTVAEIVANFVRKLENDDTSET